MNDKSIENVFKKFENKHRVWQAFINDSFLSQDMKKHYQNMIIQKFDQT